MEQVSFIHSFIRSFVPLFSDYFLHGHSIMDQHHKYICYYCTKGYDMYSELITHLCSCHNTYEIKYREKELNEISGKIGYRTKIYQLYLCVYF